MIVAMRLRNDIFTASSLTTSPRLPDVGDLSKFMGKSEKNSSTSLRLFLVSGLAIVPLSGYLLGEDEMTEEQIDQFAITLALGNNGGEWSKHYKEEQKDVWRQRVVDFAQMLKEQDPLYKHCREFVEKQNINCEETVYQTDRVIENAYEFIDGCCEIVGYKKCEDDEDEE
jgi:hypothetical protein